MSSVFKRFAKLYTQRRGFSVSLDAKIDSITRKTIYMNRDLTAQISIATLAAPAFVLLWSTGFIGAKYGLPYAEPMTFLAVRFALAASALGIWALVAGSEWLTIRQCGHMIVVGILLHAVYLGTVFTAIWLGFEAGASALIVSMQPILTAVLARLMLGETMNRIQYVGLALGILGVLLVVFEKLNAGLGDTRGVILCLAGLIAISVATLYQKKYCVGVPMRAGSAIQFLAACLFLTPLALVFETNQITWSEQFIFALTWLVLVLSLGAVGLLLFLIRTGSAGKVASLFFLVPPCTAVIAWLLFDEQLGLLAIFGIFFATAGVALVMRGDQSTKGSKD